VSADLRTGHRSGLCNCLNTVCQVLWYAVGVYEVHYEAQFICDPGFDRQPVQLLERRCNVVARAEVEN